MTRRTVEHATCPGCGCACDDIAVVVDGDRIAEARNSCPLGRAWFADGSVPRETRSSGKTVAPDVALARSEEHTSELQSQSNLVCRLLLEKKKTQAPRVRTATDQAVGGA